MKEQEVVTKKYVAEDGEVFFDKQACIDHEEYQKLFKLFPNVVSLEAQQLMSSYLACFRKPAIFATAEDSFVFEYKKNKHEEFYKAIYARVAHLFRAEHVLGTDLKDSIKYLETLANLSKYKYEDSELIAVYVWCVYREDFQSLSEIHINVCSKKQLKTRISEKIQRLKETLEKI